MNDFRSYKSDDIVIKVSLLIWYLIVDLGMDDKIQKSQCIEDPNIVF